MRLLRFIWQDLRWLNSFRPKLKVAGLIIGIGLAVGAWLLGAEFWTTPRVLRRAGREAPLVESIGVFVDIFVIVYIVGLIERDRRSRK
jgi:hypothetical protein